jgi:bifunctional non-homologous end joining protein LigD
MQIPSPLQFTQRAEPFDDPNWIYEIKHDGFRALAVLERGQCRLFSRKKHKLYGFRTFRERLMKEINVDTSILDGKLGVTDHLGHTVFASLMKKRYQIRYFAFDLLWLNARIFEPFRSHWKGEIETDSSHELASYPICGSCEGRWPSSLRLARQLDLEGIVAKSTWPRLDPAYSQKEGRGDLFKRAG